MIYFVSRSMIVREKMELGSGSSTIEMQSSLVGTTPSLNRSRYLTGKPAVASISWTSTVTVKKNSFALMNTMMEAQPHLPCTWIPYRKVKASVVSLQMPQKTILILQAVYSAWEMLMAMEGTILSAPTFMTTVAQQHLCRPLIIAS